MVKMDDGLLADEVLFKILDKLHASKEDISGEIEAKIISINE